MGKLISEKTLKLSDLILAALMGLVAIVFIVSQGKVQPSSSDSTAIVEVSGKEHITIPFSEVSGSEILKTEIGVGQWVTLEILRSESGRGKVRIVESTCPDKVCVRTGWISRPGQVIVCLPNKLVVRIESGDKLSHEPRPEFDAITY